MYGITDYAIWHFNKYTVHFKVYKKKIRLTFSLKIAYQLLQWSDQLQYYLYFPWPTGSSKKQTLCGYQAFTIFSIDYCDISYGRLSGRWIKRSPHAIKLRWLHGNFFAATWVIHHADKMWREGAKTTTFKCLILRFSTGFI